MYRHAHNPLTDAEVEKKFRSLAEPVLSANRVSEALDRLWNLETATRIGDVLKLFAVE